MISGTRATSGSATSNLYGSDPLGGGRARVFFIPGGDSNDSRSLEIKCRMASASGNISRNFLMGSVTTRGRMRLMDGREKMNLHLNNERLFYSIRIVVSPIYKFFNIHFPVGSSGSDFFSH